MTASIPHQLVPMLGLKQTLSDDIVLAAMTVTAYDREARALRRDDNPNVYPYEVPQEDATKGPWVVIAGPITHDTSSRKRPNGPKLIAADFIVPVWVHAYNVEPDALDVNAMLRQIVNLLEGQRIAVDGGEAFTITIYDYPTPQRVNKGTYIFTAIGVRFLVAAQVS